MDSRNIKCEVDAGKLYYKMTIDVIHTVLKFNAYVYGGAVRDFYRHKCIMTKYYQKEQKEQEKPEDEYLVPNDIDVFLRDHSQLDAIIAELSKTLSVRMLRDSPHRYKMGKKYSLATLHISPHYLPKLSVMVDVTYNTNTVVTGYPMPCLKRIDLDVNGLILSADGLKTYGQGGALYDLDQLMVIQKQIKKKQFQIRAYYIKRTMDPTEVDDRRRLIQRVIKMEQRGWMRKGGYRECPYIPTQEKCTEGDCVCGDEWSENKVKTNFKLTCCGKYLCASCLTKCFGKDLAARFSVVCPYCRKDSDYTKLLDLPLQGT